MFGKIAKILDDAFGNSWFLDSGSLLGVVREQKFLKSDLGIDISVVIQKYQMPIISQVEKQMEELGFITSKFDWGGVVYKYCFVPSKGMTFPYSIDFHLFQQEKENYLCPQVSLNNLNAFESVITRCKKGNKMYGKNYSPFKKIFLYIFEYFYRYIFHYFNKPLFMRDLSKKGKGETYFWVIPCKFDLSVNKENEYKLNSLINPDEYLKYRYGNWHIPVSDWVTLRDDGGLRKASIKEIDDFLLLK